MDALPSSSHQINISCNDNKNDGATQTIVGLNTKSVNNYYHVAPPTSPVQSRAPFPTQNYVAGEVSNNTQVVLTWLQDPSFHPIGVCGMGGVGKTMLLEAIFNKLYADPDIAGPVYWVNVSKSCSLYQLQEKIAQAIGFNFHGEDTERTRAASLHQKLLDMKRVVLILDDVWDCFQVEEIGIPRGENGCKMIFSTRSNTLCKRMGCAEYVLQVQPLTESEALKLFRSRLENYDKLSDDVQKIAVLVSKECHRLPLAIKVMAASLNGEYDIHKWKHALYQLRDLDRRHEDMKKKVLGIIRISYDGLKGEDLKSCFLNYEIKRPELTDFFIMDGSLDYIEERSMRLTRGHIIFDDLGIACMLEPWIDYFDNIWGVKMHDPMRVGVFKVRFRSVFWTGPDQDWTRPRPDSDLDPDPTGSSVRVPDSWNLELPIPGPVRSKFQKKFNFWLEKRGTGSDRVLIRQDRSIRFGSRSVIFEGAGPRSKTGPGLDL